MGEAQVFGVGLRGAGQVASQHLAAIMANSSLRLAALCSRTLSSAERLASEWKAAAKGGSLKVYERYEDLLEDSQVAIVSECMPNYLHAPEATMALEAGKHLILEKPAATNRRELEDLRAAARRSDKKTVVSFVLRWHPLVANIKSILDRKAIGEVYYSQFDYWHGIKSNFSSYEWIRRREYSGGAMITGGCHAADLARYLHGEIDEVFAYSAMGRKDFDYPTTYVATVRFRNGSLGKISTSLEGINIPYQFNIDLLGSAGAVRDNRVFSKELFPQQKDFFSIPCPTPNSGSVDHHPFKQEIDNLVDSILGGAKVLSDVEDASASMEVCLAAVESSESGKPVKVGS
jgi:predicted dehydrogenase